MVIFYPSHRGDTKTGREIQKDKSLKRNRKGDTKRQKSQKKQERGYKKTKVSKETDVLSWVKPKCLHIID